MAKPANGVARAFFDEVVLPYAGDDCLIWPFTRKENGRGQLRDGSRMRDAAVMACEAVRGEKPTPEHEAAHSCGRGSSGCVAPLHLRWATHLENESDKLIHGTRLRGEDHGRSRLTEDQAHEVLNLKGKMLQREIAEVYGVHLATISSIHRGKNWPHLAH